MHSCTLWVEWLSEYGCHLRATAPPEETELRRYSQPFLKPCFVIPSKPSFV